VASPEPKLQEKDRDACLVDDFGIDLSRPLFYQVNALGDRYWEWVHTSVSPRTMAHRAELLPGKWGDSVRVFRSDFLEALTHMQWWLVILVWVPVGLALLAGAHFGRGLPLGQLVGWFLIAPYTLLSGMGSVLIGLFSKEEEVL